MRHSFALLLVALLGTSAHAQDGSTAARYRDGGLPELPVTAVGGGEVLLEVTVNRTGRVDAVTPLRATSPFTDLLAAAVAGWQLDPAEEAGARGADGRVARIAEDSRVLVAGIFRPPVLVGPSLGEPIKDVAAPSGQTPFPLHVETPPYPPRAASSGVVLLEAELDRDGRVVHTTVLRSMPPFDDAARDAVAQWRFRPARLPLPAMPAATYVYVVFGFPVPIGIGPAATPKR